jgi:hypothetical protein
MRPLHGLKINSDKKQLHSLTRALVVRPRPHSVETQTPCCASFLQGRVALFLGLCSVPGAFAV